jgi:hypothetical protein
MQRTNASNSGPTMRPGAGWTTDGKAWAGPISCRPGPHENHCVGAIAFAQGTQISLAADRSQLAVGHEMGHVLQQHTSPVRRDQR